MGKPNLAVPEAPPEAPTGLEIQLADVPWTCPVETARRGRHLVSSKVGIIGQIVQTVSLPQDPQIISMGARVADLSAVCEIANSGKAGGAGETVETALAATLGEVIERYSMVFWDKSEMVFARYRDVRDHAISPDVARLHSEEQLVANPRLGRGHGYFTEDTEIYWTWGWSLTRQCPRLVPSTQVYLNWIFDEGEGTAGSNASSGLAAGATVEEAILSGLLECIERDAFAMCWLQRRVGAQVRIDDRELLERIRSRFYTGHPKIDLRFFDISTDIPIPTFFSVMRRPSELGPALILSTVTRMCPRDVVVKCIREMGQSMPYLRYLWDQLIDWEPSPDFTDLTSFDHHFVSYYKKPELVDDAMAFIENCSEEVALSELEDLSTGRAKGDIEHCVQVLDDLGFEVIVVDITAPEIRDLDLHAVRVIVPGLLPLHGNHNTQYLGVKRLYEVPRKLGWPEVELNTFPHPFP